MYASPAKNTDNYLCYLRSVNFKVSGKPLHDTLLRSCNELFYNLLGYFCLNETNNFLVYPLKQENKIVLVHKKCKFFANV